jgi:NADPH-dependent 2,4-dienoyl-CoA reductase/sulfur reductase-like enzyme
VRVVVVGGGPAGLACAIELRRLGVADVVVLDREQHAGGIPRHCAHQGFGVRDLRRLLSGPSYARRYVELALAAGVELRAETMVTGWSGDGALEVTGPDGRETLNADAVVLATGCRERPRAARLVPGSRPDGVFTTGLLQQLAQARLPIGTRALIVGAEHVSFSALLTLAHARVQVVGMVTDLPRHQSLPFAGVAATLRYRFPLWTRTEVAAIHGRERVEEVELRGLAGDRTRTVACDTVVFTGDWVPDHELTVSAGLDLVDGTRGPRVDTVLRTSRPGVFAAGNLLQGAEPADVAALEGRHAAVAGVRPWLHERDWPARVHVSCLAPIAWISPNAVADTASPSRDRFLLRSHELLERPRIEIRQDGRLLWSGSVRRLAPGRSASLPGAWTGLVDVKGGPIEVSAH